MKSRNRFFLIIFSIIVVLLIGSVQVFAENNSGTGLPGSGGTGLPGAGGTGLPGSGGTGLSGSGSSCGHGDASGTLINPLKACNIPEFLIAIVDVLIIFATPLIVIYIMYAGFKFVTAQGNPSEIESARAALLWAVVGGVIVLGAKLILEVIEGTIKAFGV
jgi:hypothetical protein